jgi:transposase
MKTGLLEVRPLFVRKESRTRGHVFCCMLALKLSREIERRRQAALGTTDADPHACTVPDAMAVLSRLCLLEYQIDEKTTLTRLPKPDARQKEILVALQVHLPKKQVVDRSPFPQTNCNQRTISGLAPKHRLWARGRSV